MLRRVFPFLAAILFVITAVSLFSRAEETVPPKPTDQPQYTADGQLKYPAGFRDWVFVGAALGLSYSEHAEEPDQQKFTNVYINPSAYAAYKKTGKFPEKTIFAMAVYRRETKQPLGDLKLQGAFEGELISVEVAVKDGEQFEDPWSYFDFSKEQGGEQIRKQAKAFATEKCYNCHLEHASDDNVFVQYYPVLRRLRKDR